MPRIRFIKADLHDTLANNSRKLSPVTMYKYILRQ